MDKLTRHGVDVLTSQEPHEGVVVQLMDIGLRGTRRTGELSDGDKTVPAVFMSQLSSHFENDGVQKYAIIRVRNTSLFTYNNANPSKTVVVVGALDVVDTACDVPIHISRAPVTPAASRTAGLPGTVTKEGTPPPTASTTTPSTCGVASRCDEETRTPAQHGGTIKYVTSDVPTTPIARLNPYQNRWTIKVRLTHKGEMITYSNQRGTGTLLKVTLTDETGDDIEAVMFNDAVTKWGPELDEGAVYYVSGGTLKAADRRYSKTKCPYEVTLNTNARIERAHYDDDAGMAASAAATETCPLDQIETVNSDLVDVLAVVKSADDMREIVSTKLGGKQLHKRELALVDRGLVEVRLTLWGELAKKPVDWAGTVLAARQLKVGEYQGARTLSVLRNSKLVYPADAPPKGSWLAPADIVAANALRAWWLEGGATAAENAVRPTATNQAAAGAGLRHAGFSDRTTLAAIRANPNLGHSDKPDYVTFKACFGKIKSDKLWYEACTTEGCQKKVTENMDGTYTCEKCATTLETCDYRYLFSALAVDHTNDLWISAFNDTAIVIFDGTPAATLAALREEDERQFEDKVSSYQWRPFLMRARVKNEVWNETARVKISLVNVSKLDYVAESAALLSAIRDL